jgi:CheY-like chemotaxis protein
VAASHTVLLVEDNLDHQDIVTAVLRHAGMMVLLAGDGETGVTLALAERPDLVLMDADLPIMDGWEAASAIKRAAPEIAVVMLSAHVLSEHRARAEAAGCDGFYSKPIQPAVLRKIVRAWVGPGGA